jgi:uncharacterized RDD family membrane protein YckC
MTRSPIRLVAWTAAALAVLLLTWTPAHARQEAPITPQAPPAPAVVQPPATEQAPVAATPSRPAAVDPPFVRSPRAVLQVAPPDTTPSSPVDPPFVRNPRPVVRFGQNYTVPAGETVREIVVISGSVTINGRVERDVVVVLGSARLGSTAVVGGSLVAVTGALTVEPGARVEGDLVVVAGGIDAPADFVPGGEHVVIGATSETRALLPWITHGLLWGRPMVPSLAWNWVFALFVFLVGLGLALLFEKPVRACTEVLSERPLSAFLVALLVLLLTAPVTVILAVSVIGIPVIPIFACALLVAVILGKIGVTRWLGRGLVHESDSDSRAQVVRSFAIGFAALLLLYMIPIIGILTWAVVGVFGLGAATLAFFAGYRRENPAPPPRSAPARPPVVPTPPVPPYGAPSPDVPPTPMAHAVASTDVPRWASEPSAAALSAPAPLGQTSSSQEAGTMDTSYVTTPPAAAAPPMAPGANLAAFPHASFRDRAAAFALDFFLVLLIKEVVLDLAVGTRLFFALLLAYHIGFWVWKGTTVGGIICSLRVVRTDGAPVQISEAIVRGLSSILSLAAAGLGAFWILRDPERQAWHDRIAGTYVVKVPRNWPI